MDRLFHQIVVNLVEWEWERVYQDNNMYLKSGFIGERKKKREKKKR